MNSKKTLDILANDFLSYKRGIGFQYEKPETNMKCFVKYIKERYPDMTIPNKEATLSYLYTKENLPGALHNTIAVLREFGRYLINVGYTNAYVIPSKRSPKLCPEPPYFFTADEITRFFSVCDSIASWANLKGREYVLPALFRILYCCGLRCKEARELLCINAHLDELYLDILQSKGPKSRRVFISQELASYLNVYNQEMERIFPKRRYFFPKDNACFYKSGFVTANFKRMWKSAFPAWSKTESRPRAYDLRHNFVWVNLNRWTKEGIDVNAMLPYLARYMGHQHIKCTLYYFRFVPEFFPVFIEMSKSLESLLPEVSDEEE